MKRMRPSHWCLWSTVVLGGLVLGLVLPGCPSPSEPKRNEKPKESRKASEPQQPEPAAHSEEKPEPSAKSEPPAKAESASQPEAKPEPPAKAEPAAHPEAKPEPPAKPESKPEAKSEGSAAGVEGMPLPPKVSSFAPAEDLAYQMDKYIGEMEKGTATESDYKELPEGKVSQTGSTMVLLAVALGASDQDNKYKANAGALLAACQKLAVAADYAATKQAVAAVVAAAKGEGKGTAEVKWARLADLKELMKQVPNVNTKLKSNLNHLKSKAKEAAGNSATLAVIAQGAMANVADTRKPAESQKWFAFCTEMREAAAAVNASIRVKNEKAVSETMDRLQKSCDDCHAIFKEEEKKPEK
jgi:hypothetical protein